MAHLQGRSQELPLRHRPILFLLLCLLARGAAPLEAQEPGSRQSQEGVQGFAELSLGVTRIRGASKGLLGAGIGFEISPRWRAGGAGYWLTGDVQVTEDPAVGSRVRLGYGGILVEWSLLPSPRPSELEGRLGLLLGAGNADLRTGPLSAFLGSDNFVVIEPGASLEKTLRDRVSVGGLVRYRLPFFVNDLGGIESRDLSGPVAGLLIRIGPF